MDTPIRLMPADLAVIGLSLAVVLAIGFVYARYARKGSDQYFLGGRGLSGWANGISNAATAMNSDVAPAYCGLMAATGLYLSWWYLSRFGPALMIGGLLFASFWRRLRLFTAPEFYSLRFGGGVGSAVRGWTAFRSAFIGAVAWTGTGLLGIHKIVGQLLGWEFETTVLVVVPVVFVYVFLSGYKGVVVSDLVQTGIMIAANVVLAAAVLSRFGGPAALGARLAERFGPGVLSVVPPAGDERLGAVAVMAWMIGASIGYGGDIATMGGAVEGQRILACRSGRDAAWMYFTSEIALFLLLVVLTLPALGGILLWPDLHTLAYTPGHDPELIYGRLLREFLTPGFLGIALAGLIASVMSTVSGHLNAGSQVVTADLYAPLVRRRLRDREMIRVGRVSMILILVLGVLVAWRAKSIIAVAIFMLGLASAELSANWAQWWWWRFNRFGRLAATFGGPVLFLAAQAFWTKAHPGAGVFTRGYLATLTGIALTTGLWVVVTLATPPDDMETLKAFYRRARPLGFWGPVRLACEAAPPPAPRFAILGGFLLAALGSTAVALMIFGLSTLYVGRYLKAAAFIGAFLILGALFLKGFDRYFKAVLADRPTAS